jgi:hypothetical protein
MVVIDGMGKLLCSDRQVVIQPTMVEELPHFFKPRSSLTSRLWGVVRTYQAEVGLLHQRRGLERLAGRLAGQKITIK